MKNPIEARHELECVVNIHIENYNIRTICYDVIHNPLFNRACGSAGHHHAYSGGLIVHTWEVVTIALNMANSFPDADKSIIVAAGIFHDFMKVKEYVIDESGNIQKTEYRNLVRHVAGSHHAFLDAVRDKNIHEDFILNVEHCILSHHGRKEYGSPIEPQTVEAQILHYADQLSATYGENK